MSSGEKFQTIPELLVSRAASAPGQTAFRFLADSQAAAASSLTYGELHTKAGAIAAQLRDAGIVEGDRVLLLFPPGLAFIAAFFGTLCAGAAAVPAYPPHPARMAVTLPRLEAIAADARPAAVLSTNSIRDAAVGASSRLAALRWMATDTLAESSAGDISWRIGADSLALVQYTSGSTASPKGVLLSHRNLLANSAIIHVAFGHSAQSRGVIWLPPYHDMGLIGGVLQPVFGGFPVTLISPASFLMRPLRWLETIAREGATTSGGPNFAFDLCVRKSTPEQRAQLDLSRWSVAFIGAEPVRPSTLENFAAAFAPAGFRAAAFQPCYGLAESTLYVTGGMRPAGPTTVQQGLSPGESEEKMRTLVGCGKAAAGAEVRIVDPERATGCADGEIGEIWVCGESVARGYFGRDEETAHVFGARLADGGDGPFLRTGDLGFLRSGELFLTGRLKNLIIIAGRNHSAEDIEQTVENAHPALRPGCSAAFPAELEGEERLVVAAELDQRHPSAPPAELVETIRRAVAERHDVRAHAVVLLRAADLPRTTSGKVQRHLCRERFLAGTLKLLEEN